MTFYYTARGAYDESYGNDLLSWNNYIKWSKLYQLKELVSLDSMLNEVLVESDRTTAAYWEHVITDNHYETGFFRDLDYVLNKTKGIRRFNLLAGIIEPGQICNEVPLEQFEFIGYELLDREYAVSPLTNCGGFNEVFSPTELNIYGLLDDYDRAYVVKKKLLETYPDEDHADTNVIAVWRHLFIGR